jgi:hypothetical protein
MTIPYFPFALALGRKNSRTSVKTATSDNLLCVEVFVTSLCRPLVHLVFSLLQSVAGVRTREHSP